MTLNLNKEFCLSLITAIFFVKHQISDINNVPVQLEHYYNQISKLNKLTKIYEQIKSSYDNDPSPFILDCNMTRLYEEFLDAVQHTYNFYSEDSAFKKAMYKEVDIELHPSNKHKMEDAILKKYFPHFTTSE